jgi:hypothetical protein
MKTGHLFGSFLLLAAGLWLTDHFAWKEARLSLYIGKHSDITQPIDEAVGNLVSDEIKMQRLRETVDRAENVTAYGKAAQALFGHLGAGQQTDEQVSLMIEVVAKHGGAKDPNILMAETFLAKHYAAKGDGEKLLPILRHLREVAFSEPLNELLVQDIVGWAARGSLADFLAETAEQACAADGLSAAARLSIAVAALEFFEKSQDAARQAAFAKRREEFLGKAEVEKNFLASAARIQALVRNKDYAGALAAYDNQAGNFPQFRAKLLLVLGMIAGGAADGDAAEPLQETWKRISAFQEPLTDPNQRQEFTAATRKSLGFLAGEKDAEFFLRIADADLRLADSPDFRYYAAGERWARGGQKGPPPKPLYVIAYRPNAGVKIDGVLDEEVYKNLQPLPGPFWSALGDTEPEAKEAGPLACEARILYDDQNLYFGVRVPEPHPQELKRLLQAGNDDNCWLDDCLEFFISEERRPEDYQQWICTPAGSFRHALFGTRHEGAAATEHPFEGAGCLGEKGYTLEVRIPLAQLNISGRPSGKLVNGNLRRNRYLSASMAREEGCEVGERQNISWSRMKGNWHNADRFDFWKFE